MASLRGVRGEAALEYGSLLPLWTLRVDCWMSSERRRSQADEVQSAGKPAHSKAFGAGVVDLGSLDALPLELQLG
jgi:hypothetical protein